MTDNDSTAQVTTLAAENARLRTENARLREIIADARRCTAEVREAVDTLVAEVAALKGGKA